MGLTPLALSAPAFAAVQSVSFTSPGAQSFTVPDGVTSVTVDAVGGAGGAVNQYGGLGAEVKATLAVTPGQTVYVHVGGNGDGAYARTTPTYNGGGASRSAGSGGGASDVRLGADDLTNRVLVAGGGGGAGAPNAAAGGDAGAAGQDGLADYCAGSFAGSWAGQPGTSGAGGAAGQGCFYGSGGDGTLGVGGDGGFFDGAGVSGGGGGGGYYGGGAGAPYQGGGGGSSYVDPTATDAVIALSTRGTQPSVTIDYAPSVRASQTITFTSTPPANATVGGSYLATATGGDSGNPVTFTAGSSNCTVQDNGDGTARVSLLDVGDCLVDADQAGSDSFAPATQAVQTVSIQQASQTITFTSTAPSAPARGSSYLATATGGASGSPVTFGTSSATCTVADHGNSTATVTFTHAGTCAVNANQAGNTNYAAAARAQQTTTVRKTAQTITFPALTSMRLRHADQALHATASSRLRVTYTVSTPLTCSLRTTGVHALRVGTCTVVAHQAGNADYLAAPNLSRSLRITN